MAKQNTALAVYNRLKQNATVLAAAMPGHMKFDRFSMIVVNAIRTNNKLASCDPDSLYACVCQAIQLGLEPDGVLGQAWLVPYGREAKLMVGYRGFVHLAHQSGKVEYFKAEVVYSNDFFDYEDGTAAFLKHRKALKDRGELICAYAVARFRDGTHAFKVLTPGDIEKRQAESKSKNSTDSPWKKWEDDMWAKSAARALAKWLPQLPEAQAAALHSEYVERGFDSPVRPDAINTVAVLLDEETGEVEAPKAAEEKFDDYVNPDGAEREPGEEG